MPPPGIADLTESMEKPSSRSKPTRKDTIMTLVELLLKEDTSRDLDPSRQEDEKDDSYLDEQEMSGAEAFKKFQKKVNNLEKELRNFANAARQLGSSAGILSSAFYLRERLAHVSYLYTENAADLFPRLIKASPPAAEQPLISTTTRKRQNPKSKLQANFTKPTIVSLIDLEDFPEQFDMLAEDITTFLFCLNEFPEFNDEAVNMSINSFASDLKYWSSCLAEYKGQFRYPAVQRYLHDLTSEMGEHFDTITATLVMYIEVGVPTIQYSQQHGAANLLNLSTVATFFSAVTATTLQFSFELTNTRVQVAVNSFWFSSLVFSIAAAVNSLMGLTWKQAMYRSPGHRVPWWVLIWIKRSPLVLLVMSVTCFSIGLCLFAYGSDQGPVTATITTVLTCITSFGLGAVSLWFLSERWVYLRHSGRKWASDVLFESQHRLFNLPGFEQTRVMFRWFFKSLGEAKNGANRFSEKVGDAIRQRTSSEGVSRASDDIEAHGNGMSSVMTPLSPDFNASRMSTDFVSPSSPSSVMGTLPSGSVMSDSASSLGPNGMTRGRVLWQNAIRTVRMQSAVSSNLAALANKPGPRRKRTGSSSNGTSAADRRKTLLDEPVRVYSRVKQLQPKIQSLEITQDIPAHQGLVRHLQFSPDGRYLATSSWDRTSVIFRVGDPFISHRILAHTKGRVSQVAWAPSGKFLVTKVLRAIKIWTEDGVCEKTIERTNDVEAVAWFPGGEALLSVEGSEVIKLDLRGQILDIYDFGKVKLQDVAVAPDKIRILGVGPLTASPSGLNPSKCRVEKRLIVYNMDTKQIENQTPVLNDVRDVTVAANNRRGTIVLVSYENKAPPQLWKMEMVKDPETNLRVARLVLRRTYRPKIAVDFAGPSYFSGRNQELVLCAGKTGDIHIWDQESGELLRHIGSNASGGDLTCIAWNPNSDENFMFATGGHDGLVRIWTKPSDFQSIDTPMITRSPSPMEIILNRTESPIPEQDLHAALMRSASLRPPDDPMRGTPISSDLPPPPARDQRSVAFVTQGPAEDQFYDAQQDPN